MKIFSKILSIPILKYFFILMNLSMCTVFDGYTLVTNQSASQQVFITELIDNEYNIINSWESPCRTASMAYLLPDSTLVYPLVLLFLKSLMMVRLFGSIKEQVLKLIEHKNTL